MAITKHKSASVSKVETEDGKKDARVVQTRKQIDRAFVELLGRRAYGNIRVSDITRKARVGRATFYAHYRSKDDLLRSQFGRIVGPMLRGTPDEACPVDATFFFDHVQTAPVLYRSLMTSPNAGIAPRILREAVERHIAQSLDTNGERSGCLGVGSELQSTMAARCVASSLISVIECALEKGTGESPQTLQLFFSRLVGGGLAALSSRANRGL